MKTNTIKLIPGKKIAQAKHLALKIELSKLTKNTNKRKPSLAIVQVGNDPSSTLYVSMKMQQAEEMGITAQKLNLKAGGDADRMAESVRKLGADSNIDGIIIQSPLQEVNLTDSLKVFNSIPVEKDVDGLTSASLGRLWQLKSLSDLADLSGPTKTFFLAATPLGVLDCLKYILSPDAKPNIPVGYAQYQDLNEILSGKNALIINRSNIVGKPLAALLQMGNATVTMAHSHTKNLQELINNADIILPATGQTGLIQHDQLRTGQIVIDIGINNTSDSGTVRGDVELAGAEISRESIDISQDVVISPVPGGVGPLTVTNLLYNTYLSYIRANDLTPPTQN